MRELVVATHNAGKRRELAVLLDGMGLRLRDLSEFAAAPAVAEDAPTYVENARAKALAAARHTRLLALADDSGLEVDALDGAPGVRSARFAEDWCRAGGAPPRGDDGDTRNLALLLTRLAEVAAPRRTARFRCVIVVSDAAGREIVAEGACEGSIARAPRGANGFGYDPVFLEPSRRATFAELASDEKQRLSHRAAACVALRARLPQFLRQLGGES